ncbi:hypothetical protein [Paenibacillus gallinarum]|uniref:DUF4179 domain-containing protein n=1 Tax=Paenibacillus gallinarum TaxID=2762232 RepID=A0ABR8SYZ0_9BACL|nr:hypothetical protein [Paenibacillus gallinarum]MBD7968721.1 hypothetical protein [Paenibacillus gallinarum]
MKEYILFLHRNEQLLFTLAYSLTRDLDQAGELLAEGVAVYWSKLKEDEQQNGTISLIREEVEDKDTIFVSQMYGIFSALVQNNVQYKRNENLSNHGIEHQMVSDRSLALEESISTLKNELRSIFLLIYLFGWENERIATYTDSTIQIVEKKQNEVISISHRRMSSRFGEINPLFLNRHFEKERAAIASVEKEFIRCYIVKGLSPAGLKKGNKMRRRKSRKTWFLGMMGIVAAAVLLLSITGFPKLLLQDNAKDRLASIPDGQVSTIEADVSYFKEAAIQEATLLKRLNSAMGQSEYLGYQPEYLGYTVRQKGIRLTIDGMMTMGSETVIWYSLENEEGDETPKIIDGTMDSIHSDEFSGSIGIIRNHRELTTDSLSKVQGQIIFSRLDTSDFKPELKQPQPALLKLDVYLGQKQSNYTVYQIEIPAGEADDSSMIKGMNKRIEINGYTITLTDVKYTKYVTEVKWEPDRANPKVIDQLVEPMLLMKVGEEERHFPAVRTSADGRTIYFPTLAYEGYLNTTEFQISGALTALENQEFIVNTDQGELIDEPTSFDGTYEIEKDADKGTITFHYTITDQENWLFLKNQYTDDSGSQHDVLEKKRAQNQFSYTFSDQEYSQPLHFSVMGYPDQIVQEAKVMINE